MGFWETQVDCDALRLGTSNSMRVPSHRSSGNCARHSRISPSVTTSMSDFPDIAGQRNVLPTANDHQPIANLELRQNNPLLRLVLPLPIRVTYFAHFIGLEENNLAQPLIGVNACRQRSRVRYLQRHEAFPFRLKRRDVYDDPTACVSRFAH